MRLSSPLMYRAPMMKQTPAMGYQSPSRTAFRRQGPLPLSRAFIGLRLRVWWPGGSHTAAGPRYLVTDMVGQRHGCIPDAGQGNISPRRAAIGPYHRYKRKHLYKESRNTVSRKSHLASSITVLVIFTSLAGSALEISAWMVSFSPLYTWFVFETFAMLVVLCCRRPACASADILTSVTVWAVTFFLAFRHRTSRNR